MAGLQNERNGLQNCAAIYVQSVPDYEAMEARCSILGISMQDMMQKLRNPEDNKVFLPLAYQKIAAIGAAIYTRTPQQEQQGEQGQSQGKFSWKAFVGDEAKVIDNTLSLIQDIFTKTAPAYPVIITEDGGSYGLKNLYRKALELYQQDKIQGTVNLSAKSVSALKTLFDDSDQWGDRKPNYLKLRFGKNVLDISDKYFTTNGNGDIKALMGEQLFKEGRLMELGDMVADAAVGIFKSYALIQDLVYDLQLPNTVFSIEKNKAKVLRIKILEPEPVKEKEAQQKPKTQGRNTPEPNAYDLSR